MRSGVQITEGPPLRSYFVLLSNAMIAVALDNRSFERIFSKGLETKVQQAERVKSEQIAAARRAKQEALSSMPSEERIAHYTDVTTNELIEAYAALLKWVFSQTCGFSIES